MPDYLESLSKRFNKSTLTLSEAACELGVEVEDVMVIISNYELATKMIGKTTVIPLASLTQYLNNELFPTSADNMATNAVTSNPILNLVEDDVDMAKGCVTCIDKGKRWLYQLDLGKTPDGKRIREGKSFTTQEDAQAALDQRLAELGQSEQSGQSNNIENVLASEPSKSIKMTGNRTLHEYLDYYLALELGQGTSRTLAGYYYSADKIVDEIGDFPLKEVTTELIARFFSELKKKYAQATLNKIYIVFKLAMDYATKKKIILENPMLGISKPKSTIFQEDTYKAYSTQEVDEILSAAKSHPELYPILLVLKYTGMRPGELRALKWSNVDFEDNTIHIAHAATIEYSKQSIGKKPLKKEVIGPTKSSYGVRTLSVPDEVIEAIKDWRKYIDNTKQYKYAREGEFLFCAKNGSFRLDNALRLKFKRFLKTEGLSKSFTLYRFRHTVCTNLFKEGVDFPTVQRIMGDNTTDVILKVYTHINSDDIKKASLKLFDSFNTAK